MLVIALCTACFSSAKINKKLCTSYFKIWPLYFECSGAGIGSPILGDYKLVVYCTKTIHTFTNKTNDANVSASLVLCDYTNLKGY